MASTFEMDGDSSSSELEPPTLQEVVADLDASDVRLRMAYSRFLDKPSPERMADITTASAGVCDDFGAILNNIVQDVVKGGERTVLAEELAGLLHGYGTQHSELLAEYAPGMQLPTPQEAQKALEDAKQCLSGHMEESLEGFVDEALEHLSALLNSDMDVIDSEVLRKSATPLAVVKDTLRSTGIETAKIGAGVLAGLFVYDRLKRRSQE